MEKLIAYFCARRGSRKILAARLGITQSALSMWRRVPATHVLSVEDFTGISRSDLRGDLYPCAISGGGKPEELASPPVPTATIEPTSTLGGSAAA